MIALIMTDAHDACMRNLPRVPPTYPILYCPITCFPTTWKIITFIITTEVDKHLENANFPQNKNDAEKEAMPVKSIINDVKARKTY